MLSAIMITGFRRRGPSVLSVATLLALSIGACDRVPLLAPTGSTITMTAAATSLPLSGSTDLIVQVLEPSGTPPQDGTLIIFTTTLGSIQPPQAQTSGGRVLVKFNAGTASGVATITASSGGATVGAAGAVKIAIGAAAVGGITISANPGTVPASGGTSTITATVVDASGNLLSGLTVTFTTDAGSVAPTLATTDSSGKAQATLTTGKTAKVTATAGIATTTTGTTTTTTAAPSASVTVNVNTTQSISVGTLTPASPTAGQVVFVPLTYGTGASPITRVVVNWGDGSAPQTYSGTPAIVSHAYSAAGSYLAQLTGVDSFGDTSTAFASVTVAARPVVAVQVTPPSAPAAHGSPEVFTISATATSGSVIRSISIDWGDGKTDSLSGNATSVQHTYTSAGTYTVTVTATDTSSASGTGSTVIVVP